MNFKKKTLPSGLRIITVPTKGNPSVTVMILVETGSNYEKKSENGLSHFLEHMCFKGTPTRPSAMDIAIELDSLGAKNNAFTNFEYTGYYAKGDKKHWKKFAEVVSDIYLHPSIPEKELEKERGVILQEISMYEDLPKWKAQELFTKLLYGDTPAGRTILGPSENIKSFSKKDFIQYRKKHYVASSTIVVVAGDISSNLIENEIKRLFKDIPTSKKHKKEKLVERQKTPALLIHRKKTDQTHMVLGFRAFPGKDKRQPILDVLSGVLGGGMSSRLFQKLREEMGACYYVRTSNDQLTDHGCFAISTGIEKNRVVEVEEALLKECKKLVEESVTEKELNKVKDYLVGNLYMDLETTDSMAGFYVEQEVLTDKLKNPNEIEKEVRKVTAKDVQKLAKEIFQNKNLNLAIVGDIKDEKSLKKSLKI